MEIYKKLQEARNNVKSSDLVKLGRNDYSGYDYYTPEQVDVLVSSACENPKLINLFCLKRNDLGIYGELKIVNIDNPDEVLVFEQATDIPSIKATNIAQQIGGAVTYTRRYMLMTAYEISDNNLDFDTPKKQTQNSDTDKPKKPWLNVYERGTKTLTSEMTEVYKKMKSGDISTVKEIRETYAVNKESAAIIEGWFLKLKE